MIKKVLIPNKELLLEKAFSLTGIFVFSEAAILCDLFFFSKSVGIPRINAIMISVVLLFLFCIGIILRNKSKSLKYDLYILFIMSLIIGYSQTKCTIVVKNNGVLLWLLFAALFSVSCLYSIMILLQIIKIKNTISETMDFKKYIAFLIVYTSYVLFSKIIYDAFHIKNDGNNFIFNAFSTNILLSVLFVCLNLQSEIKVNLLLNIAMLSVILFLIVSDGIGVIIQYITSTYFNRTFTIRGCIEIALNTVLTLLSLYLLIRIYKKPELRIIRQTA